MQMTRDSERRPRQKGRPTARATEAPDRKIRGSPAKTTAGIAHARVIGPHDEGKAADRGRDTTALATAMVVGEI